MSVIKNVNKLGELTNIQIDSYLQQYPEWIGCYARDDINIHNLWQTAGKWGIAGCMINLAPHDKPGTHWTLLCITNPSKTKRGKQNVYYFDPFGAPPPQEVVDALDDIQYSNKVCQAYNDTDCGWFDMFMFLQMWRYKDKEDPLYEAITKLSTDPSRNKELMKAYFKKITFGNETGSYSLPNYN